MFRPDADRNTSKFVTMDEETFHAACQAMELLLKSGARVHGRESETFKARETELGRLRSAWIDAPCADVVRLVDRNNERGACL